MGLSVKNFKQIFLAILILLILIPIILAIHFGQRTAQLERELEGRSETEHHTAGQGSTEPEIEYLTPIADPVEYQTLYPDLYAAEQPPRDRNRVANVVYLTIDTSLGSNTGRILDILAEYGVQATFFVSGSGEGSEAAVLRRIVESGHSVGLGSYSDSYQEIYHSVPDYLEDFKKISDMVYENTGLRPGIFRFPGGSINSYNSGIYRELISEMLRRNYVFFDWNVSGEDTRLTVQSRDQIRDTVLAGLEGKDRGIIYLQDGVGKEAVVSALPGIIQEIQGRGYSFQTLAADVLPVVFSYQSAS